MSLFSIFPGQDCSLPRQMLISSIRRLGPHVNRWNKSRWKQRRTKCIKYQRYPIIQSKISPKHTRWKSQYSLKGHVQPNGMSWIKYTNYPCCRLTVLEKVSAWTELLTIPCRITVWNRNQVNVAHSLWSAEIEEIITPSSLMVHFLLGERLIIHGLFGLAILLFWWPGVTVLS